MEKTIYRTPQIKICGITKACEAEFLLKNQVDYAGMVLFVTKSKRNITLSQAKELLSALGIIKKVAVLVSPTIEQVKALEKLPFDYLQIHGALSDEVYETISLPILRAYNGTDFAQFEREKKATKFVGFVFDGSVAGSGKTFDWSSLKNLDCDGKLCVLAGGLKAQNVREAITCVRPDIVDVSSGVEGLYGKEEQLIDAFVQAVRENSHE